MTRLGQRRTETGEYRNQNSPATFFTIYGENTPVVTINPLNASLYAGQSQQIAAVVLSDCSRRLGDTRVELAQEDSSAGPYQCNSQYGRFGSRRTALLHIAGWKVGKDRVQRIWRKEGLKVLIASHLYLASAPVAEKIIGTHASQAIPLDR